MKILDTFYISSCDHIKKNRWKESNKIKLTGNLGSLGNTRNSAWKGGAVLRIVVETFEGKYVGCVEGTLEGLGTGVGMMLTPL